MVLGFENVHVLSPQGKKRRNKYDFNSINHTRDCNRLACVHAPTQSVIVLFYSHQVDIFTRVFQFLEPITMICLLNLNRTVRFPFHDELEYFVWRTVPYVSSAQYIVMAYYDIITYEAIKGNYKNVCIYRVI